jgi:hypothetical protein
VAAVGDDKHVWIMKCTQGNENGTTTFCRGKWMKKVSTSSKHVTFEILEYPGVLFAQSIVAIVSSVMTLKRGVRFMMDSDVFQALQDRVNAEFAEDKFDEPEPQASLDTLLSLVGLLCKPALSLVSYHAYLFIDCAFFNFVFVSSFRSGYM